MTKINSTEELKKFGLNEALGPNHTFNTQSIEFAKLKFDVFSLEGVIINNSQFEDDTWVLFDMYAKHTINFNIDENKYNSIFKSKFGINYDDIKVYLKSFILLTMSTLVCTNLVGITNCIRRILLSELDEYDNYDLNKSWLNIIIFFESLPMENDEYKRNFVEHLYEFYDEMIDRMPPNARRQLCDFDSYFHFDEILEEFWKSDISDKDRLFYYPVYLWWNITGVFPTRPREFILTPRDCLLEDNGITYIVLRKNLLKGSKKVVYYNINLDYQEVRFPISKKIANELKRYIEMTKTFDDNELHTLFRTESHYDKFGRKKAKNNRFYTYVNLSYALRRFYSEIIQGKYGLNVYMTNENVDFSFGSNNIQYIHLGDTRHIAMINAVVEGVSPEMIMQLAGHESIEMSAHYYANLSTFVVCKIHNKHMRTLNSNNNLEYGKNYYPRLNQQFVPLENEGRCYSPLFINGNYSDCVNACGPNGEIGYCIQCKYYRNKKGSTIYDKDNIYKNKIDECALTLIKLIQKYQKGIDVSFDFQQTLMQLRSDKNDFEDFLYRKYNEVNEDE